MTTHKCTIRSCSPPGELQGGFCSFGAPQLYERVFTPYRYFNVKALFVQAFVQPDLSTIALRKTSSVFSPGCESDWLGNASATVCDVDSRRLGVTRDLEANGKRGA